MQEYKVRIHSNGTIEWLDSVTHELHRLDGPAVTYADGGQRWFQNDQIHRTDGPAVIYPNGTVEYWINDRELTEAQFKKATAPKPKEMTVAEIEATLGHSVKIIK